MKKQLAIGILAALAATGTGCNNCPEQKAPAKTETAASAQVTKESLKTPMDKLNYAVAFDMGKSLTRNGLEFSQDIFTKGLIDGMADSQEALLNDTERMDAKREHSKIQREKDKLKKEKEAKENQAAADKFLAENKTKEGVVTTESGLQYIVLTEGKGDKPSAEDKVTVHYKGTTIDGTEFDSSYKRNEPAEFQVDQVIPGWTEAMQLMSVGSTWELYLPPELSYGDRGAPPVIEPGSMLIFQVELLGITKGDAEPKEAVEKEKEKEKK